MGVLQLTATGTGLSTNITALAADLKQIAVKAKFLVDPVAALSGGNQAAIVQVDQDGAGTNAKIAIWISNPSAGNIALNMKQVNGAFTLTSANIAQSSLPASGLNNYVIAFCQYDNTNFNHIVTLFDSSGNVLGTGTSAGNNGSMTTGTSGRVLLNDTTSSGATTMTYDGIAIYGAPLTGTNQWSTPAATDANIQALWAFDDTGSPSSAVSGLAGGPSLALTASQFTWFNVGGTWLVSGGFALPNATVTSVTNLGNISTTGTTGGAVTGGRALLGLADTLTSQTKVQALTLVVVKLKFKVDALLAIPTFGDCALFQIDDGTDARAKVYGWASADGGPTNVKLAMNVPGQAGGTTAAVPITSLPPAGSDVIGYFFAAVGTSSIGAVLFDTAGHVLGAAAPGNLSGVPVLTNNGRVRVNYAQGHVARALDVDGMAIYSTTFPQATQWTTPSINDSGIVTFWRFDEQTGTTTSDDLGGLVLTLSNFTWESGGSWLASSILSLPVTGLASPANVATPAANPTDTTGFIAYSTNDPFPAPSATFTSVSILAVAQASNPTLYAPSVSSATAVGSTSVQIVGGGNALAVFSMGVSSATLAGPVVASAITPVAQNSFASIAHLDRKITSLTSGVTAAYTSSTDTTTWTLPYSVTTDQLTQGHLTIARTDTNIWFEDATQVSNANVVVSRPSATTIAVSGLGLSLAQVPVVIGILYTSSFQLTTIYERNQKGGVEQRGRLRLGYMEVAYEPMTNMTIIVTPQGRAPYTNVFNDPTAQANAEEIQPFRIPVQCRNEDALIVFTDSTPGSFRPIMIDWEGDLTLRSRPV